MIRHIDALEDRLGVKLFQRHAKGYALTEAGRLLTDSAAEAEARFDKLGARLQMLQSGIEGELLYHHRARTVRPCAASADGLRAIIPQLVPTCGSKTASGAAGIRRSASGDSGRGAPARTRQRGAAAGQVSHGALRRATYVDRHGVPANDATRQRHDVVTVEPGQARAPFDVWMELQRARRVSLCSNDRATLKAAMRAGLGLGFLPA